MVGFRKKPKDVAKGRKDKGIRFIDHLKKKGKKQMYAKMVRLFDLVCMYVCMYLY